MYHTRFLFAIFQFSFIYTNTKTKVLRVTFRNVLSSCVEMITVKLIVGHYEPTCIRMHN